MAFSRETAADVSADMVPAALVVEHAASDVSALVAGLRQDLAVGLQQGLVVGIGQGLTAAEAASG
jgi:hypothetical protein